MKKIFVAALLLTAAFAWWFGDGPVLRNQLGIQQGKAAPAPAQYLTAAIEEGELRRVITATGTLNAIVNVEVGSQLSGQVAELLVDFNDEVRKGQPLARLDQRSFKARVTEARAAIEMARVTIAAAKARLERARIDALDAEAQVPGLRARSDNARVKLDSARSELRRKETLRERSIGTGVDVDDAQTKLGSAEAALREAEAIAVAQDNKIEGAKADVQRVQSELDTAVATLPQKQALLEVAEIDLDRTTIRSPIDGVLVGRNVNEGRRSRRRSRPRPCSSSPATGTRWRSTRRSTRRTAARSASARRPYSRSMPIRAGSFPPPCARCARRRRWCRTSSPTRSCSRRRTPRTCSCRG